MERFISLLLVFCMFNFMALPVYSEGMVYHESQIINASYSTDLDVNKAAKHQNVEFTVSETFHGKDGLVIPQGTIFRGKIKSFKKSRWAYRRAKARIEIEKIILPDGQIYKAEGSTKRKVLKGSAIGNVIKGIISVPAALVVGVAGSCVIIVETISIVGLIIVGPTSYVVGETMGKLTHGVNYKKHEGDSIKLKLTAYPDVLVNTNQDINQNSF